MDLFKSSRKAGYEPLASRMRPRTLEEYAGQDHIIGPGRLLRRAIQLDQLSSIILYGPPGTGKTTLAHVIAKTTKRHFVTINAVLSGVKEIREAIGKAQELLDLYDTKTILFVDEVHRWNKSQQDALLPWVENGTIVLIGATIENPFFEVNRALVSRSRIFELIPLSESDLEAIARAALADKERGYGRYDVRIDEDALGHLVRVANGDARSVLNAVELAVETTPSAFPPQPGSTIHVTLEIAEQSIQKKAVLYDKEGDYHFDTASVFIKSLRGSDPDAALYWLSKMVRAGEDPRFIFRRMLILASEDVGLADPNAIVVVSALASAYERVGLPEGRFHLAEAALYLATCPKSNSAMGFFDALASVESEADAGVPDHLKDASRDKAAFGHGEGYLYPHAYKDHWVAQAYLPEPLRGRVFYKPSGMGYEERIREEVTRRREAQLEAVFEPEIASRLTFSPSQGKTEEWYNRVMEGTSAMLSDVRERIYMHLGLERHSRVLDANAKTGLLVWEALRRAPEGCVYCLVESGENRKLMENYMAVLTEVERPVFLASDLRSLIIENHPELAQGLSFEAIVGRNVFTRVSERSECWKKLFALASSGGALSVSEIIPSRTVRLSRLAHIEKIEKHVDVSKLLEAEDEMYGSATNPLFNFDAELLASECAKAGFHDVRSEIVEYAEERLIREMDLERWLAPGKGEEASYGNHIARLFPENEAGIIRKFLFEELSNKKVIWPRSVAFITARKEVPD